jgi:hypothetical protein
LITYLQKKRMPIPQPEQAKGAAGAASPIARLLLIALRVPLAAARLGGAPTASSPG